MQHIQRDVVKVRLVTTIASGTRFKHFLKQSPISVIHFNHLQSTKPAQAFARNQVAQSFLFHPEFTHSSVIKCGVLRKKESS